MISIALLAFFLFFQFVLIFLRSFLHLFIPLPVIWCVASPYFTPCFSGSRVLREIGSVPGWSSSFQRVPHSSTARHSDGSYVVL